MNILMKKQKKLKLLNKLLVTTLCTIMISSSFIGINKVHATVEKDLIGDNVEAEYNSDTETLTIRSINGVKGTIDRDKFANFMQTKVKNNTNYCYHKTITFENQVYAPEDSSYLLSGVHSSVNKLLGDASHYYVETVNNLNNLDTSKVTNMEGMFRELDIPSIDIRTWDTSKVTNMKSMFEDKNRRNYRLKNINMSGIDTSKVTDMSNMFYYRSGIESIDLTNIDVSNVEDFSYMFYYVSNLTQLDLSSFHPTKAKTMKSMFWNASKLKTVIFSNFNAPNVTDMEYMFSGTAIEEVDMSSFNTSNVTTMAQMFSWNSNLKKVIGIENMVVDNLQSANNMFFRCPQLSGVIDLSNWNAPKLTNAGSMFYNCNELTKVSLFTSDSLTRISGLIQNCEKLEYLDLSNISLKSLNDYMSIPIISNCPKLRDLYTPYTPELLGNAVRKVTLPSGYVFLNFNDEDTTIYQGTIDLTETHTSMHLVRGNLITLETNGGTINSGDVNKYKWGEEVNLPTNVTKNGYTFDGWYLEQDFSGTPVTKVLDTDTEAKTFYAKWNIVDYTITYNLDGGSITGEKTSYTIEDDNFTLVKPTKASYVFAGWTSEDITEPKKEVIIEKGNFGNKTFTANWKDDKNNNGIADEEEKFIVIYKDGNEELGRIENLSVNENTPQIDNPSKRDYYFTGWNPSVKGTIQVEDANNSNEIIYNATWTDDKDNNNEPDENQSWTVKFDPNGKEFKTNIPADQSIPHGQKATELTNTPTAEKVIFVGWYKEPACDNVFDFNEPIKFNTTIYAKWLPDENEDGIDDNIQDHFTIIYTDGQGNQLAKYEKCLINTDTPIQTTPKRNGYLFKEWNPEVANKVTKNETYEATWVEDRNGDGIDDSTQYRTITYTDGKNGESFADEIYGKDKKLLDGDTTPTFTGETPTLKDFVFGGWSPSVSGTINGNTTYTAIWKVDKNGDGIPDNEQTESVETPDSNTELTDETVKKDNTTSKSPKTGDNIGIWIVMICISLVGITITRSKITVKHKRKH